MADKKSILTLNLGLQRLGMARFSFGGKGALQLNNYAFIEIPGDPTAESGRGPQVVAAIKALAAQLKASKEGVRYAISGQPVLSKFVKLPPLNVDKMDELIGFEAQQAIPFPITEVCWHYQLLNKGGAMGETEAVLAAVKTDLLGEVNAAVEGVPLTTEGIDIAPLALYNAFRFNYPDLSQPALLVDLGSRTCNLIYIEPGGKLFFRSIPNVAGAAVTTSIAKEFSLDFAEAEQRKIASGFVALTGYADHDDPELAALSKVIRNALTRTHGEIVRTTNLYRSQQGGSAPELVFLAGGGSSLPYAKEFFEEKLSLPVEYFDALRNVALGPKLTEEQVAGDRHCLGELVGIALREFRACPMELDLVPPAVAQRRGNSARKPFLFAAAACLLGLLAAGWMYHRTAAAKFESQTATLESEKSQLEAVANKIGTEDARLKKEQARASILQTAVVDRSYWIEMFNELNALMKNDLIWITQLQPTVGEKPVTDPLGGEPKVSTFEDPLKPVAKGAKPPAGAAAPEPLIDSIHIFGLYRNYQNEKGNQVVSDYFEDIKKGTKGTGSDYFDIDDKRELADYVKQDSPSDDRWASSYEMRLPLKRAIKLSSLMKPPPP